MPPKSRALQIRADIEREISDLDRQRARLDRQRDRLLAARAGLDGQALDPQITLRRMTQDDVADYLREHPGSTSAEIAAAFGVRVTTVSAHLSRGKKSARFRTADGKWYLVE